jgi:hypothetical protein
MKLGANTLVSSGSVYIFERNNATGIWNQVQKIVNSDRAANDLFGGSVGISNNYVVVGAYEEDQDASGVNTLGKAGSAYIFERNSDTGNWSQIKKIVPNVRSSDDFFGISAAIDGNHVFVGAHLEDEDANDANNIGNSGSAYIFTILSAPVLTNLNANTLDSNSSELTLNVQDGGSSTTLTFEYGQTSGVYSNTTTAQLILGNNTTTLASTTLTDLTKNSTYYAIARAENSASFTITDEISFIQSDPLADINDGDADGIATVIDDEAPNSGDGNGDGIPDSQQIKVASLPIQNQYVTMELLSDPCSQLQDVIESDTDSDGNFIFPFGAIEFRIPCSSGEVKFYFHGTNDLSGFNYRKLKSDNTWFSFENVMFGQEVINGNTVATAILLLRDGGAEDYDGEVNGVIYDPGGPALLASSSTIPIWDWWHLIVVFTLLTFIIYRKYALA